jgi:hypothetical protein
MNFIQWSIYLIQLINEIHPCKNDNCLYGHIHPCRWIKITLSFKLQVQSSKLKLYSHAQAIFKDKPISVALDHKTTIIDLWIFLTKMEHCQSLYTLQTYCFLIIFSFTFHSNPFHMLLQGSPFFFLMSWIISG